VEDPVARNERGDSTVAMGVCLNIQNAFKKSLKSATELDDTCRRWRTLCFNINECLTVKSNVSSPEVTLGLSTSHKLSAFAFSMNEFV
jgi:hypothetical protein